MYQRKSNLVVSKEKVRDLLLLKCWTVAELAEAAGVAYNTASNFVNNTGLPYPSTIKKICAALECNPADILEPKEGGE